jgi:hypothetical protein
MRSLVVACSGKVGKVGSCGKQISMKTRLSHESHSVIEFRIYWALEMVNVT